MEYTHQPVLLTECIEGLAIRPDGIYVDGTLGRAGHSREIAKRLTTGRLLCIDRDQAAIDAAEERLAPWRDRVTLIHSNFDRLGDILREEGIAGVDGMLFDLGVSSPQLDDPARGFSYMHDAPLDMRMDASAPLTAREVVNGWSYEELRRILFDFGEERYAPAIAKAICRRREERPIGTPWSWWRSSSPPCLPPPCGKNSTLPSGASRPSASPSTASWMPWSPCWRPGPTL